MKDSKYNFLTLDCHFSNILNAMEWNHVISIISLSIFQIDIIIWNQVWEKIIGFPVHWSIILSHTFPYEDTFVSLELHNASSTWICQSTAWKMQVKSKDEQVYKTNKNQSTSRYWCEMAEFKESFSLFEWIARGLFGNRTVFIAKTCWEVIRFKRKWICKRKRRRKKTLNWTYSNN